MSHYYTNITQLWIKPHAYERVDLFDTGVEFIKSGHLTLMIALIGSTLKM